MVVLLTREAFGAADVSRRPNPKEIVYDRPC
jgi:hypothetical protein